MRVFTHQSVKQLDLYNLDNKDDYCVKNAHTSAIYTTHYEYERRGNSGKAGLGGRAFDKEALHLMIKFL